MSPDALGRLRHVPPPPVRTQYKDTRGSAASRGFDHKWRRLGGCKVAFPLEATAQDFLQRSKGHAFAEACLAVLSDQGSATPCPAKHTNWWKRTPGGGLPRSS